jgi:hypothetical protein
MAEIIQHTIKYSVDELKQIYKTGEAFRKYPNNPGFALTNDIEVGNLGHIRINGIEVSPFKKDDGNIYVMLQDKIDYKVYRLVAETWCHFPLEDTTGWHVHHISDDLNNCADNLIWCEGTIHFTQIHKRDKYNTEKEE